MKNCYEQYKEWNQDPNRDKNSIFAKVVYANYSPSIKMAPIKFVIEGEDSPSCSTKTGEGKKGNLYSPCILEEGPPYKIYSDCEAKLIGENEPSDL